MLITFKSRACADLMMLEEGARQILRLFGKDTQSGVFTTDELDDAIDKLSKEIERQKLVEKQLKELAQKERQAQQDQAKNKSADKGVKPIPYKPEPTISFSVRAYPFLQMLKMSKAHDKSIYWGDKIP